MRYSVKLFGLVALTALMVPVDQLPGLAQEMESWEQVQDGEALAPGESVETLMLTADQLYKQALKLWLSNQLSISKHQEIENNLQKSLALSREPAVYAAFPYRSQHREVNALLGLGTLSLESKHYQQALEYCEAALAIALKIGDRWEEAVLFRCIGQVYAGLGQYERALGNYHTALTIAKEISDRSSEGDILSDIGLAYYNLGQYEQALSYYQDALLIRSEMSDRSSEMVIFNTIGLIYYNLRQYEQTLSYYQNALSIAQEISDRSSEIVSFNNIGWVYYSLGQYEQALSYYQNALLIAQEISDRNSEVVTLDSIGQVYDDLSQYEQALSYYQNALLIAQEISDRNSEVVTFNNIGLVYYNLGQYEQALSYYQEAFVIAGEIGYHSQLGNALNNIGQVHEKFIQYEQALKYYHEALAIYQKVGGTLGNIGKTLNNIGLVHHKLRQYRQALDYYQEALVIHQEVGALIEVGITLDNIGETYYGLGQYQQAIEYYQEALTVSRQIGDRIGEGENLENLGYVIQDLAKPELAIVFLKQAVNQYEEIRGDIRGLTTEDQQAFTDSISSTYRKLADLLLQQNRLLEAQRVLDLLKVQELDEYLQNVQRNGNTEQGIANRPSEKAIEDSFTAQINQVIELNREIDELEDLDQLTPEQQDRLIALGRQLEQLIEAFNSFWDSPEVQEQVALLRNATGGESIDLSNYRDLTASLAALQQNAVLLYPFVLEDRLELVLVAPGLDTPIRETVPVGRVELNEAIAKYRSALQDPTSKPLPLAQQLYQWLLEPLADELTAIGAETIIYAPDAQLRYIPLAALHNGEQWIAQRFTVNNITAASLTDLAQQPRQDPKVFAAAVTEGSFPVTIGSQQTTLYGLEYAGREVENLANLITNTTKLLNDEFHPETSYLMNRYNIVHLATHAAFVPGDARESFILFGDGSQVSLEDVSGWNLPDVDLVVLSACETGLGDELGDGREILGLGYQMQKAGASASISSLWSVSDGGTRVLMDEFYAALQAGTSKAEALQQAQIALINGNFSNVGTERGDDGRIVAVSTETGLPASVSENLDHPYYWAPFILIGNGL